MDGHLEQWKEVFTPGTNSTDVWLWRLAKAHVLSHDSCIHQLVIHWYVCLYIYIHTYMHACKYIFLIKYREWRKEKEIQKSISKAFEKFKANLTDLEKKIDELNENKDLKNRYGAGIIPYEVMKPRSKPGVTGIGVPYSVSI
uniref:Lipoxygenase domain-containing protein n=1 Tax=Cucumis sativus TaxID=3659 RepID=A0A0A0KZ93_CUCSA